jgi:phospholipid/cholesterol/gamma-HCH transport system substrate-binding protein
MSRVRFWRRRDETPVVELRRYNPVRFGVIALVILAVLIYFGFTKKIPFKHGFRLNAVFSSAQNIKPKSPVREAGVDVGTVTGIRREGSTGVVTMEISGGGLPIHRDATVKIRPRIFLEGNWFVELQPGSPSAPTFSSGDTIPITHTADPVQLDQVLSALNSETRANLQNFLIGYGEGLTVKATPEEDARQEPEVRGLNAAQALNRSYQIAPPALRGGAVLNQAITGTETHDLSKLIASIGRVAAALNVHEQQLGELIGNFNTFFHAFAVQATPLQTTVGELPSTLGGIERGLASLDRALPPTRTFATEILPGVRQTNPTVAATIPWIEEVRASLAASELGGVAQGLAAATPALSKLQSEQTPLFHQTDLFNKCLTNVIIPAGNTKLQDGASTSGVEDYKEFWYSLVGLAGLGAHFDGNGTFGRFVVGNSGQVLRSAKTGVIGSSATGLSELLARSPLPPQGTRPAFPGSEPPYEPKAQCSKQALPNFNGPLSQGPADGTP